MRGVFIDLRNIACAIAIGLMVNYAVWGVGIAMQPAMERMLP